MNRLAVSNGLAALLLSTLAGCHRPSRHEETKPPPRATPAASVAKPAPPEFAVDAVETREGMACWYNVPDESLPQRKAWAEEMTAASDKLPQNGYVRIRRLDGQGEAVVVRVTDRGVHRKGALIDVSRPAAEALDILKEGTARVRVETLALKNATTDKPVEKKNEPAAPKITDTPAADQQAEKKAADAKTGGQSVP